MSRASENKKEYKKLTALDLGYVLLTAGVLVGLFFGLWMQGVQIADNGMAPVIQSGDVMLFDKLAKYLRAPARGDVYAFYDEKGNVVVGRVAALPGERVEADYGNLYVNGAYVGESAYATRADFDMPALTVPPGCFFLMPDDRTLLELDPEGMTVSAERLIGRAAIRVSPFSRVGIFG